MENKRTICYCVLEYASALLYIRAGERELRELYAQHSRKWLVYIWSKHIIAGVLALSLIHKHRLDVKNGESGQCSDPQEGTEEKNHSDGTKEPMCRNAVPAQVNKISEQWNPGDSGPASGQDISDLPRYLRPSCLYLEILIFFQYLHGDSQRIYLVPLQMPEGVNHQW